MKKIFAVAASLTAFGTTFAFAGPIEDRQAIMKSFDPAEATIRKMVAPGGVYDPVVAKAQLQIFIDGAAKFPTLFPVGSDTGTTHTAAAPTIWTDTAGFQAAAAKLGSDAKTAQAAPDAASFATAWATMEGDCGACHRTYRVRAQRPPAPPAAPAAQ